MRALLLGVAAFLAVATPSLAAAETGGHIKLTYASIDNDDFFYDEPDNTVALSGVVVTDINDQWRIQFNATTADTEVDCYYCYYSESYSEATSQGEVHATYAAGNFDVGVFAGMFNTSGSSFYEYGAEAALNFSRGEVNVSVAGATSPNADDYTDDITTVAAAGAFNLTENLAVGANVSNTNFGSWYYSGDDLEVTSYGVNVAYHIPNSDFTVGLGYRSANVEIYDYDNDVDFFGVSVAWTYGEGSEGRVMPGASALIPDAIAALTGFVI
jgi:hypothetical protein